MNWVFASVVNPLRVVVLIKKCTSPPPLGIDSISKDRVKPLAPVNDTPLISAVGVGDGVGVGVGVGVNVRSGGIGVLVGISAAAIGVGVRVRGVLAFVSVGLTADMGAVVTAMVNDGTRTPFGWCESTYVVPG